MNHRLFLAAAAILIFAGIRGIQAKDYPDWDGFPPFNSITGVVEFEGKVYGTSKGGFFWYDPDTRKYTLFYKNHGLPNGDARCVAATSRYLYLGFAASGLMRFDPRTEKLEPILFPEYVPNGIEVRTICVKSDSVLYVGHSAGVDMVNLATGEVRTFTRLGSLSGDGTVNDIGLFRGKIWVSTSIGLAVADENNPNLELASSWKSYSFLSRGRDVSFNSAINLVDDLEDTMYFATSIGILYLDEQKNILYDTLAIDASDKNVFRFTKAMGHYFAASNSGIYRKYSRVWQPYSTDYQNLRCLAPDGDRLWVGTDENGLQCYTDSGYVETEPIPGPKSPGFYRIDLDGDTIWASSGNNLSYGIIQRYRDNTWTAYRRGSAGPYLPMAVEADGKGNAWVPLFADYSGTALYYIPNGGDVASPDTALVCFDKKKEILRPTNMKNYFVCTDVVQDTRGNIWVANFQFDQPDTESGGRNHALEDVPSSGVVVFDTNPPTKFRRFSPADGDIASAKINRLCIDTDGWVWAAGMTKGVMAFNYGDDPYDTGRTTIRRQLLTGDNLYSQKISTIQVDKDGYVWVGSDAGLNRIIKLANYQLKVEQMNQLLGTASTQILSIVVDRLNNKWIGTANGLVKISPDNELAGVYTTANSGLFSNKIYDLKYDDGNDVLWIGSDAGLNSFHVFGAKPTGTEQAVRVYPNPFSLWGSNSSCTFDNLKLNSTVKVFTFSGARVAELPVTETSSKGISYTTWNGRNFKNEPVASGVYFIVGEDKSGRVFRDKMVVIRR